MTCNLNHILSFIYLLKCVFRHSQHVNKTIKPTNSLYVIFILCPAQFGSEVTTYITSERKGKYILHPAQSGSEVTIYKANENEIHVSNLLSGNNHGTCQNIGIYFCVRLYLAPRLQYNVQYTKQMKMKYM